MADVSVRLAKIAESTCQGGGQEAYGTSADNENSNLGAGGIAGEVGDRCLGEKRGDGGGDEVNATSSM